MKAQLQHISEAQLSLSSKVAREQYVTDPKVTAILDSHIRRSVLSYHHSKKILVASHIIPFLGFTDT